jgi:hypothetical protein
VAPSNPLARTQNGIESLMRTSLSFLYFKLRANGERFGFLLTGSQDCMD